MSAAFLAEAVRLMTTKEVCQRLAVGRTTVWDLVRNRGELRCLSVGGALRFRSDDIDAYIERLSREPRAWKRRGPGRRKAARAEGGAR